MRLPDSADTPERRSGRGCSRCGNKPMIQLTRLNKHPLAVNSDLIKFVEQAPDTVITLVTGEKIVVRESAEDILTRVTEFRRSVLQGIVPAWDNKFARTPPANCDNEPEEA